MLRLIADGLDTNEIAGQLCISVRTAETHRARIMQKLGIHETAGLVLYPQQARYSFGHGDPRAGAA